MTEISFSHLVRRKPNFSKGLNLVASKGEENILLIQQSLVFSIEHILTIFRPSVEISLQVSKTSSSTPILSTIFSDNELVQWDLNDSLKYNFPRDDMTEKKEKKKKIHQCKVEEYADFHLLWTMDRSTLSKKKLVFTGKQHVHWMLQWSLKINSSSSYFTVTSQRDENSHQHFSDQVWATNTCFLVIN